VVPVAPPEHTPPWPAEGEVQPVDPPWKKKLKKTAEFFKNKLAKKDPPSDQDEPA
jgi:hypothetical protein